MGALLIRHAQVTDPRGGGCFKGALLVRDGIIAHVMPEGSDADENPDGLPEGTRVIDAEGWMALPGLADPHVHFRDPGLTEKEDILTGAAAAAHGGYTSVIMMGNTKPPMDEPDRIEAALEKGRRTGVRVYCCGNVTRGMQGRELTDFAALKRAGAVLLTDDGLPIRSAEVMERACALAAEEGLIISLHEEDPAHVIQPGIHSGPVAASMGLQGAAREAETEMVARDIEIAKRTGAEITVQHISARESVELIRKARAAGVRVHAEATPHHFTLTQEAVRRFGTNAKMNPPLREEADRQAIIEGLADGTIEMIATDHAPHTAEEKNREFTAAPSGIIGLETALSLVQMQLVDTDRLDWSKAIERLTAAYGIYGLPGGTLAEGAPADMTLYAPKERRVVEKFCSKASNTPFMGEELPGVVKMTICGGNIVYEDIRNGNH